MLKCVILINKDLKNISALLSLYFKFTGQFVKIDLWITFKPLRYSNIKLAIKISKHYLIAEQSANLED